MARAMCNHLEGIFSNMQNILVFTIWIALVDKSLGDSGRKLDPRWPKIGPRRGQNQRTICSLISDSLGEGPIRTPELS